MKKYLYVGLAVLAFATSVQAQTKIYITGSSAFRGVANAQIQAALSGGVVVASSNTTLGSANAVIFRDSTNSIRVYAAWTGSAAGVQSVAGNGATGTKTKFLDDTNTGGLTTPVADPNAAGATTTAFTTTTPDIVFSDTFQAATPFNGTFGGVSYQDLSGQDNIVGVVVFQWAASNGFPTGQSISDRTAKLLLSQGSIALSSITGSVSNNNAIVYATGRNPDSGTRITALAELGFGISSPVKQYKPTKSGTTVTALALYPVETINGISTGSLGNSGENSGGTVGGYLNTTFNTAAAQTGSNNIDGTTVTAGYFLTYLGANDANNAMIAGTLPGVAVAYQGVNYRTGASVYNTNAVINGSYTFWGYEHIMYRSSPGAGVATFASSLASNILSLPSSGLSGNVAYNDMKVSRASDGGDVVSLVY